MAPFPYLPMAAILASLVSNLVVQMSVFSYAGFMVEYFGVVDDKDQSGESEMQILMSYYVIIYNNSTCCTISSPRFRVCSSVDLVVGSSVVAQVGV